MNNGCCLSCQTKATKKTKNPKEINDESDKETMEQKQKVTEKEKPKTGSNEEKGSQETSDQKDKKKKSILTWRHSSIKKEKGGGKNLRSEKNGVDPPCYTGRSMMYPCGPNPSNRWPISAAPRGRYPPFSMAPMYGTYCGGGPMQPYQSMPRAPMFDGVYISPYPPMAAAAPPPYWQTRPFMDTNPMTRYTTYADNYSYCFIEAHLNESICFSSVCFI